MDRTRLWLAPAQCRCQCRPAGVQARLQMCLLASHSAGPGEVR